MEVAVAHPFLPEVAVVTVGPSYDIEEVKRGVSAEFGLDPVAFELAVAPQGAAAGSDELLGLSQGDTLHVVESTKQRARRQLREMGHATSAEDICSAVWEGRTELYTLFCEAEVEGLTVMRDVHGCTLLHISSLMGHYEVAADLLRRGASVSHGDGQGCTPLLVASWNGRHDLVDLLLAHGADANDAGPSQDTTPLFVAALKNHVRVATALLAAGADHRVASGGLTPLSIARKRGNGEVAALLEGHIEAFYDRLSGPQRVMEWLRACRSTAVDVMVIAVAAAAMWSVRRSGEHSALDMW